MKMKSLLHLLQPPDVQSGETWMRNRGRNYDYSVRVWHIGIEHPYYISFQTPKGGGRCLPTIEFLRQFKKKS